ncbi:MAG: hypothetical protein AAFR61_24485 [Bacteroidota bacterium]
MNRHTDIFPVLRVLGVWMLFTLSSFTLALAGGGWTPDKGSGFIKLGQWWVVSDRHYTDQGIDPNTTFGVFNTSIYAEFGLTNRLQATVYAPFFSRTYFNNTISQNTGEVIQAGEAIQSFGDTDISLTYGFRKGKSLVWSATVLFGLPLGNASGGSQGNLQTGDGEFNQMIRADVGYSKRLGKVDTYYTAYVGLNNRTNGFSDEFRYGIEAGATFKNRVTTTFRVFGINSFKNGSSTDVPNSTSLFANNSEHLTISPEVSVRVQKDWFLSATAAGAVWGRLIFASPSFAVGIAKRI